MVLYAVCIYFILFTTTRTTRGAPRDDEANEAALPSKRLSPSLSARCSLHLPFQVDPHRSHLTSSAVMLCEVPEDTELERDADVALKDKALIGAWSDLRA